MTVFVSSSLGRALTLDSLSRGPPFFFLNLFLLLCGNQRRRPSDRTVALQPAPDPDRRWWRTLKKLPGNSVEAKFARFQRKGGYNLRLLSTFEDVITVFSLSPEQMEYIFKPWRFGHWRISPKYKTSSASKVRSDPKSYRNPEVSTF